MLHFFTYHPTSNGQTPLPSPKSPAQDETNFPSKKTLQIVSALQKTWMMRGRGKKTDNFSATNFFLFHHIWPGFLRGFFRSFFLGSFFVPSLLQNHHTQEQPTYGKFQPSSWTAACLAWLQIWCLPVGRISNGVPESSMTRWELKSANYLEPTWENDVFFGRFKPSKLKVNLPKKKASGLGCG